MIIFRFSASIFALAYAAACSEEAVPSQAEDREITTAEEEFYEGIAERELGGSRSTSVPSYLTSDFQAVTPAPRNFWGRGPAWLGRHFVLLDTGLRRYDEVRNETRPSQPSLRGAAGDAGIQRARGLDRHGPSGLVMTRRVKW